MLTTDVERRVAYMVEIEDGVDGMRTHACDIPTYSFVVRGGGVLI